MNTLADNLPRASFRDGLVRVVLSGGVEISFPIEGNDRLESGTASQLNNIEIYDNGLHWPDLDEDLSFEGILKGDYGQFTHARQPV